MSARPGRVGGFAYPLALFVAIGVALWGWSAWRLVRGRPTPAVVVASGVDESRGRNGTAYRPRVEYRYDVDDSTYVGTQALPGRGEGRSRAWAEAIAGRYAPGDSTTAFVDPSDAGSAFLVRQPSAGILLVIVAPLALLGVLAVEDGREGAGGDPLPAPDPAPAGPGSWALALRDDPQREAATLVRVTGRWRLAALVVVAAHLGLVIGCAAGEPGLAARLGAAWRSTLGDGFFVLDAAALAGAAWYLRRRRRAAADTAARVRVARVLLDRAPLAAGTAVEASLQLSIVGAQGGMRGTTLHLERETRDAAGKSRQREAHPPLGASGGAAPDAAHPQTFVIPDGAPPSTPRGDAARTTWAFVADLRFADGHQATLRFPVRVHARA